MRVIRFTASWCEPCKQLTKILDTVDITIPVEVVDIDINSEVAADFGIRSVPTLIMLDGNIEVKRLVGVKSQTELQGWFNG